eukprot:TRINITY_DN17273_c0_g1_i1.p1 TRINITY_DN17273_c0_g1~~TRINITY_DN17273_c0_g1_i1.p1  ORF type:complete len:419 (+),score=165.14 TRINITY_DN17273_c0_g1_i1:45-1301(+)
MEDKYEVLLTSDNSGVVCNTTVWDHTTGSSLHQFKGNTSSPNTVCLVGRDYLLSAPPDKPLLNVWQVNRSEQSPLRLFTPGAVSAMAVSPSGHYLVAAVEENINIWQVGTGALLGVVTRHYQPVTVLQFTGDSSHLLSGGADGQVLVWPLVLCVARRSLPGQERGQVGQVQPRYTWTDHALPVTGVRVGHGPAHGARVITSSLDMTVKVYTMQTGQMLLSVSFTSPITAVVMDNMETTVYAGTKSGQIHSFSLLSPPRDVCVTGDSLPSLSTWAAHTGQVTGLALGMDGCTLASGGVDSVVHLWDTPSGQVVRSLPHREGVTHVQFIATPPALLDHDRWSPGVKLVALQKGTNQKEFTCAVLNRTDLGDGEDWMRDEKVQGGSVGMEGQGMEEEHTVQELKQINNQLYKFAMKNVLSS